MSGQEVKRTEPMKEDKQQKPSEKEKILELEPDQTERNLGKGEEKIEEEIGNCFFLQNQPT